MTHRNKKYSWFRRLAALQPLLTLMILSLACSRGRDPIGKGMHSSWAAKEADLPEISSFLTRPSDRFLVDLDEITGGHPFMGANSPSPHAGAHVHFDNSNDRWSKGSDEPSNYPAIYAVADGIIGRLTTHFPLSGGNARYGFDLAFAKDRSGATFWFSYSIEPMAPEPSEGFYRKFILVQDGQRVRKGEVIAYLYTPPKVGSCHVHFHLMLDGKQGFLAPAIFSPEIVKGFYDRCQRFREHNDGIPIPPCMGYRLKAEENPFDTGAQDRL
jgi:hypothetical protein